MSDYSEWIARNRDRLYKDYMIGGAFDVMSFDEYCALQWEERTR